MERKKLCVCRYCLMEIMSREKISYHPADTDDVEMDDDGMAACDWCDEKDSDLYIID